jgi:hypothetical protein
VFDCFQERHLGAAMAYSKTGLDQKAYLCLIEAFKIFKQTKKSKENMKKKKKIVPFFLRK